MDVKLNQENLNIEGLEFEYVETMNYLKKVSFSIEITGFESFESINNEVYAQPNQEQPAIKEADNTVKPMSLFSDSDYSFTLDDQEIEFFNAVSNPFVTQASLVSLSYEYSWEKIVVYLKPFKINNRYLMDNPTLVRKMCKSIRLYNKWKNDLLHIYTKGIIENGQDFEVEWKKTMELNKNLLYTQLKNLGNRR